MRLKRKTAEDKVKWLDWEEVSQDGFKQGEERSMTFQRPSVRNIYTTLRRKLIRAPHMNNMKMQAQQLVKYAGTPDFWKYVSIEHLIKHQHINEINQVAQDNANMARCEGCQSIARSNCPGDCLATCWQTTGCSMTPCQSDCNSSCLKTCHSLCSWKSEAAPGMEGGL